MRILIHQGNKEKIHSTSWSIPWIQYCERNHIQYDIKDLLSSNNIVRDLPSYNCLLWHFGQYNYAEMLEARSILYVAQKMGLKVFPGFNEAWHFDDKVAEMYALESVLAPIPPSHVFYNMDSLSDYLNQDILFPVVAKLRTGSGSHNVKLIRTKNELIHYARKMFSKGLNPSPSLLYKASSNIRSSHDKKAFMSKLKRTPEFLRILAGAKKFPNERNYVYLQEFVPNDGFDMKVVVVGDKLAGLHRPVRSHDFRASGGGCVKYDPKLFTEDIIKSAFETSDRLGVQCMGYDYVVDKRTKKGLIVEMSYGFSHEAVMGLNGYFDRDCKWHDGALNAPEEIIKNMLYV